MILGRVLACTPQWNPVEAAKHFLDEKPRRERDIGPNIESTSRQSVFKSVFVEARVCKDESDEDNEDEGKAILEI